MNKPLDIIILTAGRADLFARCVESVVKQMEKGHNLIIHNNGFPSAEYESVYKALPQGTKIIRSNTNTGFSDGVNKGINVGNSELVMLVSDDVELRDGAISALVKRMEDTSIGLCGLKLLFPLDSTDPIRPAGKVQHVGMYSNIRGELIHALVGWSPDNPKCCVSREVLSVTGAVFITRRSVWKQVRGFDTAFGRGYYEDADYAFKVRFGAGRRVYIDADAMAYHGVGQTFKSDPPTNLQQNAMLFMGRWRERMPYSEWEVW